MPPEHLQFGGGAEETAIHPVMAIYLLIAVLLILVIPRGKVIAPFLVAFFTIPIGQVLVLGGFHFTALRILILGGLVRWVFSSMTSSDANVPLAKLRARFTGADWAAILWSISAVASFCLLYREMPAVVKQLGDLLDTLGGFLVVRFMIPDREAMRFTVKTLAMICVILGMCMVNEYVNHVNVFGYMGGIETGVDMRNGHVRAGATMGCLFAGAFSGVLIPLFIWLWRDKQSRLLAGAGIVGATAMVVTTSSSTSYMALMGGLLGLAFWPLRNRMRLVRWALVGLLVSLHMVMKAPVWALIQRIDLTGSSSGSHRFMLVDMTIRHFSDWWFLGTKDYTTWGWESWDLCNQFVAVALTGGLLTLILYLAIFSRSFAAIGTARKLVSGDGDQEWFLWCLGSSLFATVVAHFGINYMAQLIVGFFALVVSIRVVTFEVTQAVPQTSAVTDREKFSPGLGPMRARVPLAKATQKAPYSISSRLRARVTQ